MRETLRITKSRYRARGWQRWIEEVLPYLRKVQKEANDFPIGSAMKLADMSKAYKNRFGRVLLDDLHNHFNEEDEKEQPNGSNHPNSSH